MGMVGKSDLCLLRYCQILYRAADMSILVYMLFASDVNRRAPGGRLREITSDLKWKELEV